MPSNVLPVASLLACLAAGVGAIYGMSRIGSRPAPAPDRPYSPVPGWPVRRRRHDTLDTLFLDTPEFKRRIESGWESRDRERVPR